MIYTGVGRCVTTSHCPKQCLCCWRHPHVCALEFSQRRNCPLRPPTLRGAIWKGEVQYLLASTRADKNDISQMSECRHRNGADVSACQHSLSALYGELHQRFLLGNGSPRYFAVRCGYQRWMSGLPEIEVVFLGRT